METSSNFSWIHPDKKIGLKVAGKSALWFMPFHGWVGIILHRFAAGTPCGQIEQEYNNYE